MVAAACRAVFAVGLDAPINEAEEGAAGTLRPVRCGGALVLLTCAALRKSGGNGT